MNFTLMEVLGILGLVCSLGVAWWALARWMDGKTGRLEERLNRRVDECHSRINDLRDNTVGREELGRAIQAITDAIRELRGDLKGVHDRIDKVLARFADHVSKE